MQGLQAINYAAKSMLRSAVNGPLNFVAATKLVRTSDLCRDSITSAPTCSSMKLICAGLSPYRLAISLHSWQHPSSSPLLRERGRYPLVRDATALCLALA